MRTKNGRSKTMTTNSFHKHIRGRKAGTCEWKLWPHKVRKPLRGRCLVPRYDVLASLTLQVMVLRLHLLFLVDFISLAVALPTEVMV